MRESRLNRDENGEVALQEPPRFDPLLIYSQSDLQGQFYRRLVLIDSKNGLLVAWKQTLFHPGQSPDYIF